MKSHALNVVIGIIAIAALVVGIMALQQAKSARELALSEISIEEMNSLSTPVLNEETNAYSYLTLYDISIANMSGPSVTLQAVKKATSGAGFLAMLKGQDVVSVQVHAKAFISEKSSSAIKADPRLLKTIGQTDMGEDEELDLTIDPGETKIIHIGIALEPYDANKEALANMALVSFELAFTNGKNYSFQRGFPIYPIK